MNVRKEELAKAMAQLIKTDPSMAKLWNDVLAGKKISKTEEQMTEYDHSAIKRAQEKRDKRAQKRMKN